MLMAAGIVQFVFHDDQLVILNTRLFKMYDNISALIMLLSLNN